MVFDQASPDTRQYSILFMLDPFAELLSMEKKIVKIKGQELG